MLRISCVAVRGSAGWGRRLAFYLVGRGGRAGPGQTLCCYLNSISWHKPCTVDVVAVVQN